MMVVINRSVNTTRWDVARIIQRLLVYVGLFLFMATASTTLAQAAEETDGLTFSPSAIQRVARPGEPLTGTIRVKNTGTNQLTIALSLAELSLTQEEGYFAVSEITPSNPIQLGSTLKVQNEQITLPPTATASIEYTLELPAQAPEKDYYIGLLFSVTGSAAIPDHKLGIPTMFRVTRDPNVTRIETAFNPAAPLRIPATLQEQVAVTTGSDMKTQLTHLSLRTLSFDTIRGELAYIHYNPESKPAQARVTLRDRWTGHSLEQLSLTLAPSISKQPQIVSFHSSGLWRQTPLGRLPYLGPVGVQALIPGKIGALNAVSFVLPWWLVPILLIAMLGFISRILSLHPHIPHQPLRYQGRTSLMILLAIWGVGVIPSTSTADTVGTITVTGQVSPYAGYGITREGDELVISHESNYLMQINTTSSAQLVKPDDPPVRVPADEEIVIMGVLGTVQ